MRQTYVICASSLNASALRGQGRNKLCSGYLGTHRPNEFTLYIRLLSVIITLCAELSGAVYCNQSCLFVAVFVGLLPR